jgi:cytoskeletal protein RodZ
MTTRDELRRRVGARGEVGEGFAADAGPTLPERLHAARERKGVDLYRAERDTKIRSRYLAALEHGEYAELPGAVYTKGFLRNYALYLGLDAEDVIRQWKRERGDATIPAEPALAVPKPLEAPRQGLTFSPAVVVAALLTVLIAVFAVFLGVQLIRFAKPPTLAVTDPATAVIDVAEDATAYTLRGTSIPNATITVTAAGKDQPYRESADSAGNWQVDVELRRGRNQFDINALDADTGKTADTPARVFITVPFNVAEAPALTVDSRTARSRSRDRPRMRRPSRSPRSSPVRRRAPRPAPRRRRPPASRTSARRPSTSTRTGRSTPRSTSPPGSGRSPSRPRRPRGRR